MILLATFAMAAPLADCSRTYVTGELRDALDSADAAFARQDAPGFGESAVSVRERVGCFSEPLVAAELARIHLSEALAAFLAADATGTTAALAAMAAASPGYQIPLSLVPDGHPIRGSMAAAGLALREGGEVPLLTPNSGWIEVDGVFQKGVATTRHAVIQRFGPDGKVEETRYHRAGTDLGDWAKGTAPTKPGPATKPEKPAAVAGNPADRPPTTVSFRADLGTGFGIAANREVTVNELAYDVTGFGGLTGTLGGGIVVGTPALAGTFDLGWTSALALSSTSEMVAPAWHGGIASVGGQYRQPGWALEAGLSYAILGVTAEVTPADASESRSVSGTLGCLGGRFGAAIRLGKTAPWAITGQVAGWVGRSAPMGVATVGVRYDSGWAAP